MQDLTRAQKARVAIRSFKTIAYALALRGFYRPSGKMGQTLADCLITLSPEIYGSMNDPRVVELNGLEYVIDRLPRGIEDCTRIILTEEEQFEKSPFEKIIPLKRRRSCYRISENEICFVITRGMSEIYDILTHITFLNLEAKKIQSRMTDETDIVTNEWHDLEKIIGRIDSLSTREAEQAIWDLSLIMGRSYHETRKAYESFEKNKQENKSNNGLFSLIYQLGKRVEQEKKSRENLLTVHLTPSLMNIIAHQRYGEQWAEDIKKKLLELNLQDRPLHIISANLHSVQNLIYGHAGTLACENQTAGTKDELYHFVQCLKDQRAEILKFAGAHGFYELPDRSGTHIDCQIIDTALLDTVTFHPDLELNLAAVRDKKPVILVMDYAFGAQAFEVMDRLLEPFNKDHEVPMNVQSISVMGKAGILPGEKGDIMLATAHVIEGTSDNYIFENDLAEEDFDPDINVYVGPMVTVIGTSLQNRDMLEKFQSSWNTVGLEMEGGHYQRAISASIIKGHISKDIKVRYAYYASDNPLASGQTLAAGEMGTEGIRPTYMVTKVILEKIFS
ncbi:MAG: hypothetical protein HF978_19390 [Desulfobacteraceae bacterium]|nr:hypothetical protein [Desulfobacteraceae bacterium]MBC2757715.1 hypothetical protein [Desulfobacteraceae bacterium]